MKKHKNIGDALKALAGKPVKKAKKAVPKGKSTKKATKKTTKKAVSITKSVLKKLPTQTLAKAVSAGANHRNNMNAISRTNNADVCEIGPLPKVVNPKRKARCKDNLQLFGETYFDNVCEDPFSIPHIVSIDQMEIAIFDGGNFAIAMPRGFGKTVISWIAVIWAIVYGHISYAIIIGANDKMASKIARTIRKQIERKGSKLSEDFPEVCYPVAKLDNKSQRAAGQTLNGVHTNMTWTGQELVFPTVKGSACSSAVIEIAGITSGNIRGNQHTNHLGNILRPQLVVIDDAQTKKTAKSVDLTDGLEEIINQDIMGMEGSKDGMAIIYTCTVIRKGDLADRFLDQEANPDWSSTRTKLMISMPKNMEAWEKYNTHREDLQRENKGVKYANEGMEDYYLENIDVLEEGAWPSWEHKYTAKKGEISAIQYAMHKYFKNKEAFFSEYQNEPLVREHNNKLLEPFYVAERLNGLDQYICPANTTYVTAYIDVGQNGLWYAVGAFDPDVTGSIIDYGIYPEQSARIFSKNNLTVKIKDIHERMGVEGYVTAALKTLCERLLGNVYKDEDGNDLKIQRLLVDKGWKPEVVNQVVKDIGSPILIPALGARLKATSRPLDAYKDENGMNRWYGVLSRKPKKRSEPRHYDIDTRQLKTFFDERLRTARGDSGAIHLYGQDKHEHKLISQHLTSEYSKTVKNDYGEIAMWEPKPGSGDNDWFDCCVGLTAAALTLGARLKGFDAPKTRKKRERRDLKNGWGRKASW